jgi:hypothetical protein
MSTFERRRVFESLTNVPYTAGQGGVLVYSQKFTQVENAAVVSIAPPGTVGTIALQGVVLGTGMLTGTVGTAAPAPNGIHIFVQEIVGDTGVTEAPTGTIDGPIVLWEEGV